MKTIKKYTEYITESKQLNYAYSILTAVAVFTDFFDFLQNEENRYEMNNSVFWQSFIFKLRDLDKIKYSKSELTSIKDIDIKNDWSKLKRVVSAADKIRNESHNIESIKVKDNKLFIQTSDDLKVLKNKETTRFKETELANIVGLNINDIYDDVLYTVFIDDYLKLLNKHLKRQYKDKLNRFTILMKDTEHDTFNRTKLENLGLRIEEMPALYYSKLNKFCEDISSFKEAYLDYEAFKEDWLNLKKSKLIRYIIIPKLEINKKLLKKALIDINNIEEETYYSFNSKMVPIKIPSKDVFLEDKDLFKVKTKYYFNDNKDLVINFNNEAYNFKILIKLSKSCPSKIKMTSKYVEL